MTKVELNNISKSFKKVDVIHDLSLQINDGELVVILGPTGSGKSTILHLIAGLDKPTSGEIKFDGEVVNKLPASKRNVATVCQNHPLFPYMTVYESLAYELKKRGMKSQDIALQVELVAKRLHLDDILENKPKALSEGQRQRVALGRALILKPAVFLLDEPLSNLDARMRFKIKMEIRKLHRELGATTVYVTHDQEEAMTLADKLVVLNNGRIEQVGKPTEVYERPATQFVAEFVGSPTMNFIPATVNEDGDGVKLSENHILPLAKDRLAPYKNKAVTIGVRPEALKIASSKIESQFRVRIDVVEDLGSDTIIYGEMLDVSHQLVAKLPGHVVTHAGEVMTLSVRPGSIYLFDDETGSRLS